MDIVVSILAVIAGIAGIVGSVLPVIPGPPISWTGLLLLYFWGGTDKAGSSMSLTLLLVWLGIVIAVSVIDYLVPMYFTRLTGGSKYAMAGLLIGLIVPPVGMIVGSFIGAFLAELIYASKSAGGALKSAIGSFLGFLTGTGLKLITTCVMFYYIIVYL